MSLNPQLLLNNPLAMAAAHQSVSSHLQMPSSTINSASNNALFNEFNMHAASLMQPMRASPSKRNAIESPRSDSSERIGSTTNETHPQKSSRNSSNRPPRQDERAEIKSPASKIRKTSNMEKTIVEFAEKEESDGKKNASVDDV